MCLPAFDIYVNQSQIFSFEMYCDQFLFFVHNCMLQIEKKESWNRRNRMMVKNMTSQSSSLLNSVHLTPVQNTISKLPDGVF